MRRGIENCKMRIANCKLKLPDTLKPSCLRDIGTPSGKSIFSFQFLLCLTLLGCRSAAPRPAPLPAVTMAARAEDQAGQLSQQQQNWPAAVRAWQLTVDRFSLLNDVASEATALHNLAQAEREIGAPEAAHRHLEEAARLNEKLGRTNDWWRNQIGLLQVEAQPNVSAPLTARIDKLLPLASRLHDSVLRGLFLNEVGLWRKSQGDLPGAEKAFTEAEQDFKSGHDSSGLATVSANRAALYEAQNNYEAAIASWKTALQQFQLLRDPQGITPALAGQGRALLLAKRDLPTAEDLLRRAARNYRTLQKPKQAQATLDLLAQCLIAQGKQEEADAVRKGR